MRIKVIANNAGIFAKVILIIQTIKQYCTNNNVSLSEVSSIYLESTPNSIDNLFDYVLEQEKFDSYDVVLQADYSIKTSIRMSESPDLKFLYYIFDKVKIKGSVLERVNPNINENTIGVHIRLTDMNTLHKNEYGVRNFGQYLNKINSVIKETENSNIFIASDNAESIVKLEGEYDIITNIISNRHNSEIDTGNQYNNFLRLNHLSENFWVDSFLDMLSLAKCGNSFTSFLVV